MTFSFSGSIETSSITVSVSSFV